MSTLAIPQAKTNPSLLCALELARQGGKVFPCYWPDEQGKCSCGEPECNRQGKHPLWERGTLEHGKDDATSDERQILAWSARWPWANWAFVPSSLNEVVIDMDGEPGQQAFKALPGYQKLPETYTVKTGRQGGYHAYLSLPAGLIVKEGDLVERVLTAKWKGYVMLDGCVHYTGRQYAAIEPQAPVARCPEWLLALLAQEQSRRTIKAKKSASKEPSRHNLLVTRASQLHKQGLFPEEIEACLLADNSLLKNPKPESEVRDIARWIGEKPQQGGQSKRPASSERQPKQPAAVAPAPPQCTMTAVEIARQVLRTLQRFVILSLAQACIVTLWVMHCHALEAADATPYLNIYSPEKGSGKTRLLEVLRFLTPRPWFTGSVSAAVLFRSIEDKKPTLLLDESDAAFGGDKDYAEALRGVLNTGNDRDGKASRCERQGNNFVSHDYATFCPKAIAGIGDRLPDTVRDRSIPIRLQRKLPDELVERFRRRKVEPELKPLVEQIAAWGFQHSESLRQAEPLLPDELSDRQQDGAEPLLAIADAIGGEWPGRARAAFVELYGSPAAHDQSIGVRLLSAVRCVFKSVGDPDRMSSAVLRERLIEIEGSPWAEWKDSKPITACRIARLLGPYDIHPRTVREGKDTFKGYWRESFEDAWNRYLRSNALYPPFQTVTASQPAKTLAEKHIFEPSQKPPVTDGKSEDNPLPERIVTAVTASNGGDRENRVEVVEI